MGPTLPDWYRNLRIVLKKEKKFYVLTPPYPEAPVEGDGQEAWDAYAKYLDDLDQVACIMLASMTPELQKQHEHMNAQTMILRLKELFSMQSRIERYEMSKELFRCRMAEGSLVREHVLKMINLIERLGALDFAMDGELSIDLVQ